MHGCIVEATSRCDDPTPANILDALMIAMLKVTPCYKVHQEQAAVRSTASSPIHPSSHLKNAFGSTAVMYLQIVLEFFSYSNVLVLVLAAVTAANILI